MHIVAYMSSLFLCMDALPFDYSFTVEGYLSCFQFVAIINQAATSVYIPFLYKYTFIFMLDKELEVDKWIS